VNPKIGQQKIKLTAYYFFLIRLKTPGPMSGSGRERKSFCDQSMPAFPKRQKRIAS
jgi:hypothetical protein